MVVLVSRVSKDVTWMLADAKARRACTGSMHLYSAAVDHKHIPITYHIPGWVATLALVVMNITSRRELAEPEDLYVDEHFAAS